MIITGKPALISTLEKRLIVTRDDKTEVVAPWAGLASVLLLGNHHVTTPAMRAALGAGVPIHLAGGSGRYQGVIQNGLPGVEGGALWLRQLELFRDEGSVLSAARQLVMARLRHMRETLRQRRPTGFHKERAEIQARQKEAGAAASLQQLNGFEGSGARSYFQALAGLVPEEYGFTGRNRRPPRDPFNALLSLGYTILYTHMETLLQVDGLYPWLGFYHQPHGRHAALASDLMEPFRHVVERVALTAVIRKQVIPTDFHKDHQRGCRMNPVALKKYLALLWERFDTPTQGVGEEESYPILQQAHRQNRRVIAWLRDGEEFTPWLAR